jgi:hypothetical protein
MLLALFAALPAHAGSQYQSAVLAQNPAGYWRLNETAQPVNSPSTANHGSLSGADGFYTNSPSLHLPGPFTSSYAVGFDGSSQEILTPWQSGLNPSTFSFEFWLNPAQVPYSGSVAYVASSVHTASPRSGWYFAQDNGTTFGAGSAFVVRLFNQNGTTPSVQLAAPVTKPLGSWYHIVLTYDGTTATLYEDGVAVTNYAAAFVANVDLPTTFACRSDLAYRWPGQMAQAAIYNGALSAARVAAHYTAATTEATYVTAVQQDTPVLWYQFLEIGQPPAANSGTLSSAATGTYQAGTTPGVAGPSQANYLGFELDNYAVSVPGTGPAVSVPALNLNTNTVTITGWINPSTSGQSGYGGIVACAAGTTTAGLILDYKGSGLTYLWNNDVDTYNWVPDVDASLPDPNPGDWSYVALVVHPDQASIYICASNNAANWTGVTNFPPSGHPIEAFDGATLFGFDADTTVVTGGAGFNGVIDEVAIFNRALGEGELYSQYGAAVGGLKPIIFGDLQGPTAPVAVGDPIVLSLDSGGTPPLTYTWHRGGTNYASTSTGVLTITNAILSDAGTYNVNISNGSGSTNSQQVQVQVVIPSTPQIQQIVGYESRTLYPTGTLSFAAVATGGGLKYQWYKNTAPIASATSSDYTIAHVTTANAGSYSLSVTNVVGAATSGPPAVITIPSVTAGSYEAAIIASVPEAWWRLDESAGSTNLFDGMGRHPGVYTNAAGGSTLPTLGVAGALVNDANTAASFTSAGQGIGLIPYSASLNNPVMTVEAWVKTSVMDGQAPVSSSYGSGGWWMQSINGWWYGNCSGGYFGNNGDVNTLGAIVPGYWSHIVMEYGNTGNSSYPFQVWINGATDGYIWGGPSAGLNAAGPFIIGGRGVSATTLANTFFDGQVDEVAVYTRGLTGTEITAHYTARGSVPVVFTTPLLSQTVTTGKSISFSTGILGTTPIYLQWYKNGAPISSATNASYAITNTALGDTGTYTLWATNAAATNSISATLAVYSPFAHANVTNGLVLHLKFDGDTTDSSGRGNNGTPSITTPPVFVSPGIVGSHALQYTTTTDTGGNFSSASYVTLGTVGSGPPADLQFGATTSFSVGLWIQQASGATNGDLPFIGTETNSDNNPGWVLAPTWQTGGWQWDLDDGSANIDMNGAANSFNDGNWHHFMLTVDRTAKVADTYLDGVLVQTTSIASLGSIDNNNYWPIVIGQDPTLVYAVAGSANLDDIGIWRQALTPLEVAEICSAGSTSGRSFDTVAPPLKLSVTPSGVLNYSEGTLLQSPNVGPNAHWTPVPGSSPPSFTIPKTGAGMYYRVFVQ